MIDITELDGEARAEAERLFASWEKPAAKWPSETAFEGPTRTSRWSCEIVVARLPNGHVYDLMYRMDEDDPRTVPPVFWSLWIDERTREVFAHPRIANMWCGLRDPRDATDEAMREVRHGKGLGLDARYRIGRLSRPLRERTRTVTDGWGY